MICKLLAMIIVLNMKNDSSLKRMIISKSFKSFRLNIHYKEIKLKLSMNLSENSSKRLNSNFLGKLLISLKKKPC